MPRNGMRMVAAVILLLFITACGRVPEYRHRPSIPDPDLPMDHLNYLQDELATVSRGLADSLVVMRERQARRIAEIYRISDLAPEGYRALVVDTAKRHHIEPRHLAGLVIVESRWDPEAKGAHGEIGLGQIMVTTAEGIAAARDIDAYDLEDPATNLDFAAWFLAALIQDAKRDHPGFSDQEVVEEALRRYNAGPAWRTRAEMAARSYSRRVFAVTRGGS